MGKESGIEWTHHTFNPWRGCTKVSPGCANCYADQLSGRNPKVLGVWGPKGSRVIASDSYWREPIKWNEAAKNAGERHRVFCASLADIFEGPETMPPECVLPVRKARWRLLDLVYHTPFLDWLFLTKRPQNMPEEIVQSSRTVGGDDDSQDDLIFWATDWAIGKRVPQNVWLGTSVEDQPRADERIAYLLKCPAVVHFLSIEPMLGSIILPARCKWDRNNDGDCHIHPRGCPKIDWVIVGGESGPGARPMHPDWAKSIRDQCIATSTPFFFKQWGCWSPAAKDNNGEWCEDEWVEPDGSIVGASGSVGEADAPMVRSDKKSAGRLLDGREWNEMPSTVKAVTA